MDLLSNETEYAQLPDIHCERPAQVAAVAGAVTGLGLCLLMRGAEERLPDDHDLVDVALLIRLMT